MIPIYEKGKTIGNKSEPEESFLEHYAASGNEARPLVIVCPGGGYNHLAKHEGVDVAKWWNEKGVDAVVFYYKLKPVNIDFLLKQIDAFTHEFKNDSQYTSVGIIGFSAGGHLAALASAKNGAIFDFSILSYPVITMVESFTHAGSKAEIMRDLTEEYAPQYSPEQFVSKDTPKTFIWHTAEDQSVPDANALLYANKLSAHRVPYELHIFQTGRHGLGMADNEPFTKDWTYLLERWLKKNEVIA